MYVQSLIFPVLFVFGHQFSERLNHGRGPLRAISDQHNASSGKNLLRCINNPASRATARFDQIFRYLGIEPITGKPCVYVGMTGLDPDTRFDKHKAGIQSNRYVQQFGLRLLPNLYEVYNPMPYDGARDMEVELGISLREAGFGVWQA